jgi:uncharacterized membrane protein
MKEDFKSICQAMWQEHRGKTVGAVAGIILGTAILCFGFWRTFFVLCCGLVGLYVGAQMDQGENVLGVISDRVLHMSERFLN